MNHKPTFAIFSDSNFFSIYLLETFLSKPCEVIIFAPDKKSWLIKTHHITNRTNFRITGEKNFSSSILITYAVFCSGFLDKKSSYKKFNSLYNRDIFANVKSIAIFPAEVFDSSENSSLPLNSNLSIVYLSDLLGPRVDLEANLRMDNVLQEVLNEGTITAGIGEVFYPLFAPYAAKQISKWIFSFGPYGKEVFLTGGDVSPAELWKEVIKVAPGTKLFYDKKILPFVLPRGFMREILNTNLTFLFREIFGQTVRVKTPVKKPNKQFKVILLTLVSFLLFPIVSLLISAGLLYASYKSYLAGRTEVAKILMSISRAPSAAGKLFAFYSSDLNYGFYLTGKIADIGLVGIEAAGQTSELVGKILGNEVYSPGNLSKSLGVSLEYVYQSVSLLESETKSQSGKGRIIAPRVNREVDFEKLKKLILAASEVSRKLPEILGQDKRQTYLLLFQNNMELRPTGGFIGSFAIVAFEGGRMIDFSVSDVYSADGQLKGHIEPPEPIRKYLGEANWFLRDSNWDPDFPTSARRIEWFINKEIDRNVDGVIGVDLYPVKDLLEIMGPIYLADYNMDISSENLYEKTQEEVQEDFFPGTQKKASFLTALSRNIVSELGGLNARQKTRFIKALFENLSRRHIQIFLHNEKVQKEVSNMGWAGEVAKYDCGQGCYGDFLSLVEANVGVNKANYFISRDQSLDADISGDQIKRTLTINFKNSANPALGAPVNYKSYVRILIPADAEVQAGFDVSEVRGLKEVGFLVEVIAGQERQISLSWSSPVQTSEYGIYIRKQAGTDEEGNLSVAINGNLVYNANLTTDIWIQKP